MSKRLLHILITLVLVLAMLLGIAAVSTADEDSKLVLSGITMRMLDDAAKPGDGSVQGFLEIKVRNIDSAGVGFTLQYDPNVVNISEVATNKPANGNKNWLEMSPYIKWNTEDFKSGTFMLGVGKDSGIKVDSNGSLVTAGFDIVVDQTKMMDENRNLVLPSDYKNIKLQEYKGGEGTKITVPVVDGKNKTLTLGSISFRISDPASFAKMTSEQLSNVFRLKTDDSGASVFMILYVDNTTNPPLVKYDTDSHLAYEFAVDNALSLVKADRDNAVTNAAEVYINGMESDLLAWMNANMSDVTAIYADGTKISSNVTWGNGVDGVDYEVTAATGGYDPKGGTYTVWQKFNDDIKVQATVTVKPVKALGFIAENDYLHYLKPDVGVDTAKIVPAGTDPKTVLSFPETVSVVFDTVIPSDKADLRLSLNDDWQCDVAPNGVDKTDLLAIRDGGDDGHGVEGQYEYSASVGGSLDAEGNLSGDIFPAWVTDAVGDYKRVDVVRVLGAVTPAPIWQDEFTAWVEDNGTLKIDITAVDGVTDLATYDFFLRLPNGLVLKNEHFALADNFKIEHEADGSVLISVRAETVADSDPNASVQDSLRQAINLGDRLGKFALAAKSADKPQSDWTEFATEPRRNVYLGDGAAGTDDYSFDFSSMPLVISYATGTTLPNTIALPTGESVKITYSGLTGMEPGKLSTITVDDWTTSDTPVVGGNITFVGTLKDGCLYADHGTVKNPNGIKVSITLQVVDGDDLPEEKINELTDIIFAKMQVGYTTADSRSVTIKNVGGGDINGLTVSMVPVSIAPADSSVSLAVEDVFTMTVSPPFKLAADGTVSCTIDRNMGLPVGSYKAQVIVGSNRNAVLDSFYVSVEIVENPVFSVIVEPEPTAAGTTDGSGNYEVGENVVITATEYVDSNGYQDYDFDGWEVVNGVSVSFTPSATDDNASFSMPDLDTALSGATEKVLRIKGKFREGEGAVLRLQDLRLYNPDSSQNSLLQWDDVNNKYAKIEFAPLTRGYFAIVPSGAETNRVEFDFALPADSTVDPNDIGFEIKLNGMELQKDKDWHYNSADGKGVIEALPIKTLPEENILTITLKRAGSTVERAYTVNIKRKLAISEMGELEYGNSPFGLIMRAGGDTEANKEEFRAGNCFKPDNVPPHGKLGVVYHPEAWGDTAVNAAKNTEEGADRDVNNYDRNDWALFIYHGEKIEAPAISNVKNSLNEAVDAADVKMAIRGLVELTSTADKLTEVFKQGEPFDLELAADGTAEWPKTASGDNKRVRPGVYYLSYEFKDYNGDTVKIDRPVIVLYGIGDVDMSGAVNKADAAYIANRYNALLPNGGDSSYQVYKYRICDTNRDRNINVGDRNAIIKNQLVQFYAKIEEGISGANE